MITGETFITILYQSLLSCRAIKTSKEHANSWKSRAIFKVILCDSSTPDY